MSTLKTNNIEHLDASTPAIQVAVGGGVNITGVTTVGDSIVIDGASNTASITGVSTIGVTTVTTNTLTVNGNAFPSAGPLSNRNLIINGAMQVAQRGTQETGVTSQGYLVVDRYRFNPSNLGTWTLDQDTNAPSGFSNSFKITCTTADASPAAGDLLVLFHFIEAQNLQHLKYGDSGAENVTLSFWVKSNKTGSASFTIRQPDNSSKLYSTTYNISSADTWEYKTITIPGDTGGVINNDTGIGLQCEWWLNSGTDYSSGTASNAWVANDNTRRNPSNLGVGGAISDYYAITGVQLEVGERATPFEHRSYGEELARCQRYYYKTVIGNTGSRFGAGFASAGNLADGDIIFPVTMRTDPTTIDQSGTAGDYSVAFTSTAATCTAVPTYVNANVNCGTVRFTVAAATLTQGHGISLRALTTDAFLAWSAEL